MKNDAYSITHEVITKIVNENDEQIMKIIEDYVKKQRSDGHIVNANIIPEGKLRHIINLGMTVYAKKLGCDLEEKDLFDQEQYIEFLRKQIEAYQQENKELKNQICILKSKGGEI